MTPRPDLNSLAKEVYEAAKAKGFHEYEASNETSLMLVICELAKAVEADRKGKRVDVERMLSEIKERRSYINDLLNGKILARPHVINEAKEELEIDTFKRFFEYRVKDTIEDELADAVIRLLDLAGLRGCDRLKDLLLCPTISDKKNFPENIFAICTDLIYYKYSVSERISFVLLNIEYLCKLLSIDLWLHVELKLKYNQSRPYKHGKVY